MAEADPHVMALTSSKSLRARGGGAGAEGEAGSEAAPAAAAAPPATEQVDQDAAAERLMQVPPPLLPLRHAGTCSRPNPTET